MVNGHQYNTRTILLLYYYYISMMSLSSPKRPKQIPFIVY